MADFRKHPDPSQWDDYVDFESKSWPKKDRKHYWVIPSICFNCESACGILAYVDKETLEVRKIEGNPVHPGSRGRTCAKGVVTPNQLDDPDRILYPLKRVGPRGSGEPVPQQAAILFCEMRAALEIFEAIVRVAPLVIRPNERFEISTLALVS